MGSVYAALLAEAGNEAYAVARAKGVPLSFGDPVAQVRAFGEKMPHARPAMLLGPLGRAAFGDRPHQRRDPGLGCGGRRPRAYNEVVSALVRATEEGFG